MDVLEKSLCEEGGWWKRFQGPAFVQCCFTRQNWVEANERSSSLDVSHN